MTSVIAGKDCLISNQPENGRSERARDSLEHVADDAVGLSRSSVIRRNTISEDLQGRIAIDTVLGTQVLLGRAVDLASGEEESA